MASTATKRAGATEPGQYGSADIQVLEGVAHVRLRPGMYIGTTSSRGLHHLVYEVVDNSIDEAMAGHCDRIIVRLLKGGGVEVEDNGRGIPVKPDPQGQGPASGRGGRPHDPERRGQVRRRTGTGSRAGSTGWASPS